MMRSDCMIFIVDDDQRICAAMTDLLTVAGYPCIAFDSVASYLAYSRPDRPSCLVLDVSLPGISGLDFQKQIDLNSHPPIVFVTGHGDIPSAVHAIQRGAVNFLTKPFRESELLSSVEAAIALDRTNRGEKSELVELQARLESLTPREREVLPLVAGGLLNKQAAALLGISKVTLQIHRSKIMQKMGTPSLADLVRVAEKLQIPIEHGRRARKTLQ
jgi:FixJ family two-component response regulator